MTRPGREIPGPTVIGSDPAIVPLDPSRVRKQYPMPPIRVLVVDDSIVVRKMVTDVIDNDPDLQVVGTARNGIEAIARIDELDPDIMTLDVEMPELDGLGTLARLRELRIELPVIMFSTLTMKGSEATLDALTLGARDYVAKPANVGSVTAVVEELERELVPKLKALAPRPPAVIDPTTTPEPSQTRPDDTFARRTQPVRALVVASSTGGPGGISPKYCSIQARACAGSKSPTTTSAALFGA